jgi:hypothetical protein
MPRNPSNYRPRVAKAFVRDIKSFFVERDGIKADGIAARELNALNVSSTTSNRFPPDEGSPVTTESHRPRETKTEDELAAMIREDLLKVDGCPERGVLVTVYGIPWKAMLMFGAKAGPVHNKAELKGFFDIIVERLQRLYDVS